MCSTNSFPALTLTEIFIRTTFKHAADAFEQHHTAAYWESLKVCACMHACKRESVCRRWLSLWSGFSAAQPPGVTDPVHSFSSSKALPHSYCRDTHGSVTQKAKSHRVTTELWDTITHNTWLSKLGIGAGSITVWEWFQKNFNKKICTKHSRHNSRREKFNSVIRERTHSQEANGRKRTTFCECLKCCCNIGLA